MSRLMSFTGGDPFSGRKHNEYKINDKHVTFTEYRRRFKAAFGSGNEGNPPLRRTGGARGRKRAIDDRCKRVGCDHEFEYHEEHEDYGCYGTRTDRWLECPHCQEQRAATWEDAPTYDEDYV